MEKIYDQAKDKNVAAVVIYGVGGDGKAYKDPEGTIQMTTSELKDAFCKRSLVHYGDTLYCTPLAFIIDSDGVGKIVFDISTGDDASLVSVAD